MHEHRTLPRPTEAATWARTFPATRDQASAARTFLASRLADCPLHHDAIACLGELVNNAVIHSRSRLPGGTFTVRIEQRPDRLRVEVRDLGGPWSPSPDGGAGTSGRGLLIVAALADRWGISPTTAAAARTAWFEMALP